MLEIPLLIDKPMKTQLVTIALSLFFCIGSPMVAAHSNDPVTNKGSYKSPTPSARWQPVQVVSLQLEALRGNNPKTDDGIATAYGFASPRNRKAVGGLANFTRMLHGGYPDMLTHVSADIKTVRLEDDEAVIGTTLTLADKTQHKYIFLLKRRAIAPCEGCWLTDGVIPVERREPPPLQQI